jgi:hypothetical protein
VSRAGDAVPVLGLVALLAAAAALAPSRAQADPPVSGPAAPAPGGDPAGGDLERALEANAPAIVSLQFLLKYEGGYESSSWAHGAVVDPDGLVLLSASDLGGSDAKIADIKVLFGSDPKEWSSILVARDTSLDLAFVQILGTEGRPFRHVDLAKSASARAKEPRLGETIVGISRTGRGFDYAPSVQRLYFTCRIDAPRKMWDFRGDFAEAGLPVFDLAGNAVAVLTKQASAEGADEGGGTHEDVMAIPLAPVLKTLEAVRKRVPEALKKAEDAKKEAAKADEGTKVEGGVGRRDDGTPSPDVPKPPEPPAPAK